MATPKKKKTGEGLYKKRFATLKEHRAAVAARKALKGGKNVGPVANADAYGSAIKKKTPPKASTPKASTPKTSTTKTTTTSSSSKSGVNGNFRKSNPPSPTVRKAGSTTGASVDPRERSLRRNRSDAARGSRTAGRANIQKQVDAVSGSSKRNQRLVEARRRRARQRGLSKNRRELLARRNNDM